MPTQRQHSRQDWSSGATVAEINSGSLQRIADATELMAQNFVSLQNRVKYLEDDLKRARATRDEYWRKIAALKGVITKLKKKSKL